MKLGFSSWELSLCCWLGLWGMPTTPSSEDHCLSRTCRVRLFAAVCSLLQQPAHFCRWCFQSFTTCRMPEPIPEAGRSTRMKVLPWHLLIFHSTIDRSRIHEALNSTRFSYGSKCSIRLWPWKDRYCTTKYQLVSSCWTTNMYVNVK